MKKTLLWCSLGVLSLVGTAWSQDKHPDNASDQVTSVENAIVLQVQKADKQSKIFTKENFPALATVALGLIGTLLSVSAAWAKDFECYRQAAARSGRCDEKSAVLGYMVEGFSHGGSRVQHRRPESSGQSRDSCRRRLGASGLSQAAGESLSRHPARPGVFPVPVPAMVLTL